MYSYYTHTQTQQVKLQTWSCILFALVQLEQKICIANEEWVKGNMKRYCLCMPVCQVKRGSHKGDDDDVGSDDGENVGDDL